jgi:hypothetical protein
LADEPEALGATEGSKLEGHRLTPDVEVDVDAAWLADRPRIEDVVGGLEASLGSADDHAVCVATEKVASSCRSSSGVRRSDARRWDSACSSALRTSSTIGGAPDASSAFSCGQIVQRELALQRRREHVDALVRARAPEGLPAEQPRGLAIVHVVRAARSFTR